VIPHVDLCKTGMDYSGLFSFLVLLQTTNFNSRTPNVFYFY
jgi:hypothetical protein